MTIQFSPNHPTSLPDHHRPEETNAGHVRHDGADSVHSQHPAGWRDMPPDDWSHASPHQRSHVEGQVPLPPPPHGEGKPETRKHLAEKFNLIVTKEADTHRNEKAGPQDDATQARDSTRADGQSQNANSGNASGETKPNRHFNVEDALALLVKVSGEDFKMYNSQTQAAANEKVQRLEGQAKDTADAGKDREIGSIAAASATALAGVVSVVGAGISGASAVKADIAVNSLKQMDPVTNTLKDMDMSTKVQQFANLTARSNAVSQGLSAGGSAAQGGMNVMQGVDDYDASLDDADKTQEEAAASADDALHDNAQNAKQQYQQVMQDFVDREKTIEQTRSQTDMAIAHA